MKPEKEEKQEYFYDSEKLWQMRLKSIFELDYEHRVFEEVSFKNEEEKGRLDLYLVTSETWEFQRLFPYIGIECKVFYSQGMGWLINSASQMRKYCNPKNIFKKDGIELPPLSICLVATPESWHEGYVYKWNGPEASGHDCCWKTMTFIFERMLLKESCSILLNKKFQSNKEGSIRNYSLGK